MLSISPASSFNCFILCSYLSFSFSKSPCVSSKLCWMKTSPSWYGIASESSSSRSRRSSPASSMF
uniref:Uncharacterized protein n=1 Tax=Ciona intestinalis TaxID=7719 RepID=H2XLR9_CIOIN